MNGEKKIILLIQKLAQESKKFQEVFKCNSEYYFRYMGHAFSILQRQGMELDDKWGEYGFYIYPNYEGELSDLAESFDHPGHEYDFTHFDVKDFDHLPGAVSVFASLYHVFQTRDVDGIIDEILGLD